ncbi:MAG: nucleotidyl transferase AbiEii/AbiGii toxin family protein [Clostridiales bacterium]|jgi:hypothetical protein|nr:nucleotidyl transferase AbiEii/AbiGii toxin family protein [Clostridiales bacterium]
METVLAEKLEAIINLNTLTTRMKDFYDVAILTETHRHKIDHSTLAAAIANTSKQRGSTHLYTPYNVAATLVRIGKDAQMAALWKRYQQKNPYATEISFADTVKALRTLAEWGGLIAPQQEKPDFLGHLRDLKKQADTDKANITPSKNKDRDNGID